MQKYFWSSSQFRTWKTLKTVEQIAANVTKEKVCSQFRTLMHSPFILQYTQGVNILITTLTSKPSDLWYRCYFVCKILNDIVNDMLSIITQKYVPCTRPSFTEFKNNNARNQVDVNKLFSFDVKTHISNLVWVGSHTDYFVLSTLLVL